MSTFPRQRSPRVGTSARRAARFAILLTALAAGLPAQTKPGTPRDVAILYDGPTGTQAKGYIHALFIENLLGHFGLSGEVIPMTKYQPGQLQRYRAAFFVGVYQGTELPKVFVEDVRAYGGPFCWLGQHVEHLLSLPRARQQYGFRYIDYNRTAGATRVMYKNTLLDKREPDLNFVAVESRSVEVVATALTTDQASHPYALHRGRFWYFADSPFAYVEETSHYLAFCDLLHDILEIQHPADQRALVRIEDVSIDDDPVDLKRVSDLLAGENVPFQIALIPVFRNPARELEVRLTDRRSFTDSLHYMISRGGTPIMHGVTHQYRTQSGDDYEFWDDSADRPVSGDSAEFVMHRLELGLSECFATGIYPVAFETPHYGASAIDYRTMRRVFTLFYDRTMSTPTLNSLQYFPYPVVDIWGRFIVPENLGYVPQEKPSAEPVIDAARRLRVVRDGIASFYFHSFMKAEMLDEIIRSLRGMGYRFISIREFPSEVNYQGHYVVRTASGEAHLAPQGEFWRLRLYDRSGNLEETRLSETRQSGPVDVAVSVPQGGWAALDCIRDKPMERVEPTFSARIQQWWSQLFASERAPAGHAFVSARKAWLLWLDKTPPPDTRDLESYRAVLDTFGYEVRVVKVADFTRAPADATTIVFLPQACGARLAPRQVEELLRYLSSGGRVVLEGRLNWLDKLGFHWEGRYVTASTVSDQVYPEMSLRWRPEDKIERFTAPEGVRELMTEPESGQTLALSGNYGSGQYVYLAALLDPHTSDGTSHYPYFPRYLTEAFGANTSLRSPRLEAYFDPSYRPGADYNRLAAHWRRSGIRIIYAAAWISYARYSFNYDEFVRACHRNGVSVYAWFIFPAVTPKMWEDHPEWRERAASGADGRVGWRPLMNFQNPACYRAAMDWMKAQLASTEWDGVNISELNYDADFKDYLKPEHFVPMNAEVRADFRRRGGFDPELLFQPGSPYYHRSNPGALQKFLRYRENLVTEWHRRVLGELEPIRRARNWEVVVTAMDSLHSRYVRPALGVDSRRIIGLMKEFNFTLQVEDPAEYWMQPPDRYRRFAQTYLKLVKDPRRLMFDVNVVADRDIGSTFLPSFTATGVELARTVVAAASASGRVAIYAEHTVPPQDWALLRMALTRDAELSPGTREWKVNSRVPVMLTPSEDRDYYLDGRLWPAVSIDGVLAPPGRHWISIDRPWHHFLDPGTLPARLLSLSGDLLDARVLPTGLVFRYWSPGRAVVLVNQWPREVRIDGRLTPTPAEPAGSGWTMTLPPGDHWVALTTNTKAGVAVSLWGWASASAINAFGTLATVLMVLIYFEVRLRRLIRRRA